MILQRRFSVLTYIILSNAISLSSALGLPSRNHEQAPVPQADSPSPNGAANDLARSEKTDDNNLSITHLNISLKTDFQTNRVETVIEADIENTSPNPVSSAEFWLCPGGWNDPDFGADVSHVYLLEGDIRKDLEHTTRKITDEWESCKVALPKPVSPGRKLKLRFEYTMTGKPDHSSAPIQKSKEGFKEVYLRGGDYLWCPEPYYDLDRQHVSRIAVRPTWTMRMDYPAGYVAITNGELQRRVEKNGLITDQWKSLPLLPGTPYLYIGPYKVLKRTIGDLTFEMYAPDEQILNQAAEKFDTYARIFSFYTELYGEPVHPTYRIIGSALDNVGNSFTTGQFVNMNSLDDTRLITHEMSHTWWGGAVSPQGPGWKFLTEAMAEFSEEWVLSVMGEKHDERLTDSTILAVKQSSVCPYSAISEPPRLGGPLLFKEGFSPRQITNWNYNWGPLVVNQIRCILGDGVFFKCLRTYLDKFRGKRPGIEDFIHTINKVSGKEMTSELEGLLSSTGFASYRLLSFESERADGGFRTKVRIENEGDYGLTCPLLLKTIGGDERATFKVEGKQTKEFIFPTAYRVVHVIIDPDSTTLQYHPEQKVRLFMALKPGGNEEYYGKAYMYYALGEHGKAVDTISDYLHRAMRRHATESIDELLAESGMAVRYVFMRGIFRLGLEDPTQAEQDIKRTFPHMLRQMVGTESVRAPEGFYWVGAIGRKNLGEYLELLSVIVGSEFAFESGLDEPARKRKVEQWKRWWEKKGKHRKLDLTALKERSDALRNAFRKRELSLIEPSQPGW